MIHTRAVKLLSDLDSCSKDKKCKLEHQICKEIQGEQLCGCLDGYYPGFRQCKGNILYSHLKLIKLSCKYLLLLSTQVTLTFIEKINDLELSLQMI